jgi:hypothetical protein
MSGNAMKWAREQHIAHAGLKYLVDVLAMDVDSRGFTWRSQLNLAEQLAVSERAVRQRLAALEKLGVIQRGHRSNGAGGRSSDVIRLRIDLQFTITKATAKALLQPAKSAGSDPNPNRQISTAQPANSAGDKGSDQLKSEIATQEPLELSPQSALRVGGRNATLRVLNGGRA